MDTMLKIEDAECRKRQSLDPWICSLAKRGIERIET